MGLLAGYDAVRKGSGVRVSADLEAEAVASGIGPDDFPGVRPKWWQFGLRIRRWLLQRRVDRGA